MKRSSSTADEGQIYVTKKRKTVARSCKHHRLAHQQLGADIVGKNPQDGVLIDYGINKAICVGLYGVGFTTVTRKALSTFRDAVEEHMLHLSARVKESMQSCRRSRPTPQDFIHALAQFNLSASSLKAELDLEPPEAVAQAPILAPLSLESASSFTFMPDSFLPPAEKPALETLRKPYIPRHFPDYPAMHAYHSTPVYSRRETEAIRIRERATEEGMHAEQALRKLMAANKAAENSARELARRKRGVAQLESEEVWRDALAAADEEDEDFTRENRQDMKPGLDGAVDARDGQSLDGVNPAVGGVVNYDRMFWRRGVGMNRLRAA